MKTSEEYVNSLRGLDRTIYLFGEKLENPLEMCAFRISVILMVADYRINRRGRGV